MSNVLLVVRKGSFLIILTLAHSTSNASSVWNCSRKFLNSDFEDLTPLNLTNSNINNVCSIDRLFLLLLEGAFSFVERVSQN